MSDITYQDKKLIVGEIKKLEMNPTIGSLGAAVEIDATIQHPTIWTDCIFCKCYVDTRYRFLDEGLCEKCRTEIIKRIQLILDFQ